MLPLPDVFRRSCRYVAGADWARRAGARWIAVARIFWKKLRSLWCALLCSCLDSAVIASVCLVQKRKNYQERHDCTVSRGMQRSQQGLSVLAACYGAIPPYLLGGGHVSTDSMSVCGRERCDCPYASCAQVLRGYRCHVRRPAERQACYGRFSRAVFHLVEYQKDINASHRRYWNRHYSYRTWQGRTKATFLLTCDRDWPT